MTFRNGFYAAAIGVVALVAVLVVVPALALRDRLPDPLATHWGLTGQPDGKTSFTVAVVGFVGLWGLMAGVLFAIFAAAGQVTHRTYRAWFSGMLAGTGIFIGGLALLTIEANLDRSSWEDAGPVGLGQVALVLLAAVLMGAVGGLLGRRGPHVPAMPPRNPPKPLPVLPRPGDDAVWVSRVSNRYLIVMSALFAVASLAGAAVALSTTRAWVVLSIAVLLLLIAVVGWLLATVRVEVNRDGLTVGYGGWGWPTRRTPLAEIARAWAEDRRPAQVGGWGYRGLPGGNVTVMIRSGPCLVIQRRSGSEFAVSADEPEHGAALIEALRAR